MKKNVFIRKMLILFLLMTVLMTFSCSTKSIPKVDFVLKSNKMTNQGNSFYVVVKETSNSKFISDSYDGAQKTVFEIIKDDPLVLATHVVIPNEELKLKVNMPNKNSLGLYGFFSKPGPNWKIILSPPFKSEYEVFLGKNNLKYPVKTSSWIWKCLWPF